MPAGLALGDLTDYLTPAGLDVDDIPATTYSPIKCIPSSALLAESPVTGETSLPREEGNYGIGSPEEE